MRTFISIVLIAFTLVVAGQFAHAESCEPTRPDSLGPFYTSGAPDRSKVGEGYLLTGVVMSSRDCSALKGARIEFWLTGPDGRYDDEHRATVFSGASGSYRFESNFPPAYYGRPPHIHIRVSADDYRTLVTQHYPESGTSEGTFDLILIPER
jgi:protocatechuate 3,4-dioxygenase beta subunit